MLKDYAGIPKLGPALSGDLGGLIIRGQTVDKPVISPTKNAAAVDLDEQRRLAEIGAARLTTIFTESRGARMGDDQPRPEIEGGSITDGELSWMGEGTVSDQKLAFVNARTDQR